MPDPRATYATRFNTLAIRRPQPPAPPMTDEQFEVWVSSLPQPGQAMARLGRSLANVRMIPTTQFVFRDDPTDA